MSVAIDKAVMLARKYLGSDGIPIKSQQRLYTQMSKAIERVAKENGLAVSSAHEQIQNRASSLGAISPQPGKDY